MTGFAGERGTTSILQMSISQLSGTFHSPKSWAQAGVIASVVIQETEVLDVNSVNRIAS